MLVILPYCLVMCRMCDWAVCWFDERDTIIGCPDHQNMLYRQGTNHFRDDHQHAYGAIVVTPDMMNEHGTVELWRGKRNGAVIHSPREA